MVRPDWGARCCDLVPGGRFDVRVGARAPDPACPDKCARRRAAADTDPGFEAQRYRPEGTRPSPDREPPTASGSQRITTVSSYNRSRDIARRAGRPRIAIIGGQPKFVRKAHELGADVLYIQHPDRYDTQHAPHVEVALLVDYTDVERLLTLARALYNAYPFRQVISLWELGLMPAARVADALGIADNPLSTVEILLDKWRMRRHLNSLGISTVAAAVGETEEDLREFIAANGLPVLLKPICEGGSIGVFAIRDESLLASTIEHFGTVASRIDRRDLAGPLDRFLMEEFLDGPEISVETLSFDGRHVLVGVTDKVASSDRFVETGHSSPSRHPGALLREVELLVMTFLDAVGLRHGPAHTEVKLTSRGPKIVESHNRIGGDRINELTEIAYGVDMDRYALGARLGLIEPLQQSPRPVAGAAIRFLTPSPGRVTAITGVEEIVDDPALVELDISVKPGADVPSLAWNEDRVGHVLARGKTADEAIANCERLMSAIRIHTEPVTE